MDMLDLGLIGFGGLLALMALGVPIGIAMAVAGLAGSVLAVGERATMGALGSRLFSTTTSYELSVVPMFILMGALITRSGIGQDLYNACYAFLGRLRGGLAMATVVACGGFSAVCGSSIATAATMARVAMPPMRSFGYADSLASASIAAGGTLGILIPPSVILVLYGFMTSTDVGQLFIAGILPGILAIALYVAAIAVVTWTHPHWGPPGERTGWPERLRLLSRVGPIVLLFLLIIGTIYFGVATPTEAAGVGAFGALLFALWRRTPLAEFGAALVETARTTASLFFVLLGALIFANFLNFAGLTAAIADGITSLGLGALGVILVMLLVYLVLGCFMESLSMILLTVPIFFEIIRPLGIDPVWFGIFIVMVTELSLITPPVGLNLFVIKGVVGDLRIGALYAGITPFVIADLVRVALIIALPGIALLLPAWAG